MEFTAESVMQDFTNLGHPDPSVRQTANQNLLVFKVFYCPNFVSSTD